MSKRGLEPLRPFERQPLKLVRLPISPLRRGTKFYLFSAELGEEHSKRYHGYYPYKREHRCDAIQVALSSSRTQSRSSASTEHVAQSAAATAMEQDSGHERYKRQDVDDNGDDGDEITHGKILPITNFNDYSGKWQADCWPEERTTSLGSSTAHSSVAFQHRVRKRQPVGGFTGEGTSPSSMIL